jgi:GNAT superfamily N-acetyltransferase
VSGSASDDLVWRPLEGMSWDEAAEAFTGSYAGYVIPVRASGADLAARCRAEDVDLRASYVIRDSSGPVAVGLVARRGVRARLAAFAVVPRMRGKGVARPALARLVGESVRRGDETMELEVFEHNLPAVRLYERAGFTKADRLAGFELPGIPDSDDAAGLRTFPIGELAAHLATDGDSGLPWQLESETVSRMSEPWQVVGDGEGAFALVDLSRGDAVALRLMFTVPASRRAGRARALLAAIRASAGDRPIRVPQLIPERNRAFMQSLGFAEAEHGQLRMRLEGIWL